MLFLRVFCIMLLSFSYAYATDDTVIPADLQVNMRDHGYMMGDVISMQVTFSLQENQQIDQETLPLAGRVKHWIDIQSVQFNQQKQHVNLTINWQLFGTVERSEQLKTPQVLIKTIGKAPQTILIPQQAFYYSSVLPKPPLKDIKRRTDWTPPAFDTRTPFTWMSMCLGLLGICAFIWLWLKDKIPWLPYQPGPMTKLYRLLKKQSIDHFTPAQLREIHNALNASAGSSLYPNNLATLFENAPYFQPYQTEIETFFHASWEAFYGDKTATKGIDASQTMVWIEQTAIAERLTRRAKSKHSISNARAQA